MSLWSFNYILIMFYVIKVVLDSKPVYILSTQTVRIASVRTCPKFDRTYWLCGC